MLITNTVCCLVVLCFFNSYHGLEHLPKDIAPTDKIRDVVNQIFTSLKLKTKKDSKLKEYSTIHKLFVNLTQLENDNWKKVTKLTALDSKIDNSTTDFTTIINDILNEDNETTDANGMQNDEDVNGYIENFLSTLARLKEIYLVNNSYSTINTDVLEHLHKASFSQDNNHTAVDEFNSTEDSTHEIDFWKPSDTRRIFRGERTKIKYFPFLVSVHLFNQFTCAGSIIQSSLVITAASCLQLAYNNRFYRENPAFLSVRIGSPFYNAGGEKIAVLEVYFHPTYTPRTLRDNLAIMRLEKKIKFRRNKRNVKKIEIDRNDWALPMNTNGITIAGWGAKTTSNKVHDPWTNKVSMAVLPVYPLDDCQDIYSKEYVSRKNFCAGFMSKGGGACNRDVGAPGIVHGILAGVVSFGAPTCGTADAPTVFTKLGYYYDWIETIMEQEVPVVRIKTTLRPLFVHRIATVTIADTKNFKLDPIDFKNIKSLGEIEEEIDNENQLRMDKDTDFENFLETMFKSKDYTDHKVELPNVKTHNKNFQGDKKGTEVRENTDDPAGKLSEPLQSVTSMGRFDAEETRETNLDETVNFTELEKISQINEVEDETDLEINDKTTPMVKNYGLSIEVPDDLREGNQDDTNYFNNERKDTLDESKTYLIDKSLFNNELQNQVQNQKQSIQNSNDYAQFNKENKPQEELSQEILKDDFNFLLNAAQKDKLEYPNTSLKDKGSFHQFNEVLQHQAERQKQSVEDMNDNTEVEVSDGSLKLDFNPKLMTEKKHVEKLDVLMKHDDIHKFKEKQYEDKFSEESIKDTNDKTQLDKQNKKQVEFSNESVKFKDIITQLNNERMEPVEAPGAIIKNTNTKFNKRHQHQITEREKITKGIDNTHVNVEPKYQTEQPDVSVRYQDASTQLNEAHHNQVVRPKESVIDVDDTIQFNKGSKQQVEIPDASIRDVKSYTKFNKQYQQQVGELHESTKYIDDYKKRKHEVEAPGEPSRDVRGYNQFNEDRKHEVQKLNVDKDEILDEKLQEQIDQLLKKLDVEKAIGSDIDYSNERKVIEDTKLLELIESQDQQRRLDATDENLLTFLFLSENERKNVTTKQNEESNVDKEGLSRAIDDERYKDLTHRINSSDDSYDIMSKSEMYDILADAIRDDDVQDI